MFTPTSRSAWLARTHLTHLGLGWPRHKTLISLSRLPSSPSLNRSIGPILGINPHNEPPTPHPQGPHPFSFCLNSLTENLAPPRLSLYSGNRFPLPSFFSSLFSFHCCTPVLEKLSDPRPWTSLEIDRVPALTPLPLIRGPGFPLTDPTKEWVRYFLVRRRSL